MRATPAGAAMSLRVRQHSLAARRRIGRSERGSGVGLPARAACMLPVDFSLQENDR
jgi:hypothetical protein